MKKFIIIALGLLLFLPACQNKQGKGVTEKPDLPPVEMPKDSVYDVAIVSNPEGGYGYHILSKGQQIIVQLQPPGFSGNEGFKTKEEALRVATLVITKMNAKQIPPTVTQQEMDSMGIE